MLYEIWEYYNKFDSWNPWGVLLICQNATVWVCGAWIKKYNVFCSKTYSPFGYLSWTPCWFATDRWGSPHLRNSLIAIDQSHRYGRHQAACREPAGSYDKTTRSAICFEHKTQYLLISAPYTRIVAFGHISNIPPMISQSQISCNTPTFYIAPIFVKYCYITGSWLL